MIFLLFLYFLIPLSYSESFEVDNYTFVHEEYSFPNYPEEYQEDEDFYTLLNISQTGYNFSKVSFYFYEDSNCFIQGTTKFGENDKRKSSVCIKIGECLPLNYSDPEGWMYQLWVMSSDELGAQMVTWIDFFNFFGKCDYNKTNVISEEERGGYLFYDSIRFGSCSKGNLFDEKYFISYLGCEETGDFQHFFREQSTPLIIGLVIIVSTISVIFCCICIFGIVQLIFLTLIDIYKGKNKNLRVHPLSEEIVEEEHNVRETWKDRMKKLTVFKSFFGGGGLHFNYGLHFPKRNVNLCCVVIKTVKDFIFSILMIIMLEVRNAFSLWFSIVCFLNTNIPKTDPLYIQSSAIYSNYETVLLIVFVVYLAVEIIFLIFWINRHILHPIKVVIAYPVYREWLVYRFFMCSIFFFYIFYGIPAFFNTNDRIHQEYYSLILHLFDDYGNVFGLLFSVGFRQILMFYFKLITSTVLLLFDFLNTLFYDGSSSINYYHRMNDATGKCSKVFPFCKGNFPDISYNISWLFANPDKVLHKLITVLSLCEAVGNVPIGDIDEAKELEIKDEIKRLSSSIDFGNYPFYMIKKLSGKEIKFLKACIFGIGSKETFHEEQFYDVIMYTSPVKITWIKTLLFHSCLTYCKMGKGEEVVEEQEKNKVMVENFEDQRKDKLINKVRKIIRNNFEMKKELNEIEDIYLKRLIGVLEEKLNNSERRVNEIVAKDYRDQQGLDIIERIEDKKSLKKKMKDLKKKLKKERKQRKKRKKRRKKEKENSGDEKENDDEKENSDDEKEYSDDEKEKKKSDKEESDEE